MKIKIYAALLIAFSFTALEGTHKNVTVMGTGYVGLVLGACLAEWGHHVICADILEDKIKRLQQADIPIFEPGLTALVVENCEKGTLEFTSDIPFAIRSSEIIFVAVGTPTLDDGSTDVRALKSAIKSVKDNLDGEKVICIKSTVPVGTTRKMQEFLASNSSPSFDMCFCPEFLREGSAVSDFFKTDRLVIGAESDHAREVMRELFAPLLTQKIPLLETSLETAEAIKYASNAFLAAKISFINEFANFCQAVGADISGVAYGMGLDKRIGPDFLKPGPGFGGSCFPKDTLALLHQGKDFGIDLKLVSATIESNEAQKILMVEKLEKLLAGDVFEKTIAVLGLAFKANTDDVRMSPSETVIKILLEKGAKIKAYDPIAMPNMKKVLPDIEYGHSVQKTIEGADAVAIITDWEEFKQLDWSSLSQVMKQRVLLDARNLYDPYALERMGFSYDNVGRR